MDPLDTSAAAKQRRQRAPKTTADQYEHFLNFAEHNQSIVDARREPQHTEHQILERWTQLASVLNTSGRGPQRNVKDWQSKLYIHKTPIRTTVQIQHVLRLVVLSVV